jgi:hypothetical protein
VGEDLERFLDVAEHRGRADAEPGGEVGVGLALAQVRQHEQGLAADTEPAPSRADLAAVCSKCVGEGGEGVVGLVNPAE